LGSQPGWSFSLLSDVTSPSSSIPTNRADNARTSPFAQRGSVPRCPSCPVKTFFFPPCRILTSVRICQVPADRVNFLPLLGVTIIKIFNFVIVCVVNPRGNFLSISPRISLHRAGPFRIPRLSSAFRRGSKLFPPDSRAPPHSLFLNPFLGRTFRR